MPRFSVSISQKHPPVQTHPNGLWYEPEDATRLDVWKRRTIHKGTHGSTNKWLAKRGTIRLFNLKLHLTTQQWKIPQVVPRRIATKTRSTATAYYVHTYIPIAKTGTKVNRPYEDDDPSARLRKQISMFELMSRSYVSLCEIVDFARRFRVNKLDDDSISSMQEARWRRSVFNLTVVSSAMSHCRFLFSAVHGS